LDELSEGAGFSGRCPSGREHGPEIDPGQFPILQNMSRLSMNALCSCGISLSTTCVSTLSASHRVSKRSCNERWRGPYNRLM
jgi:hypothetical protein